MLTIFPIIVHDAYDKPDPADWDFMVGMFWPQEPPINPLQGRDSIDIIREIKRRMAAGGWAEPWTSIAAAIDESQPAYSSFISYWETKRWDDNPARGKVTLMGDAAHPMPPRKCTNPTIARSEELSSRKGHFCRLTISFLGCRSWLWPGQRDSGCQDSC